MLEAKIVFLLLSVFGAGLLIAGVYLLLGLGFALLAASSWCFVAAAFLAKGIGHG